MSPIKLLIALFGLLVWTNSAFADGVLTPAANESSLTVTEVDGSPAVTVNRLKVTNGTLTDNGDGTATVTVGGGTGDVVGPASSTDNAIVRFDLATGKLVQSSGVLISDANDVSGAASYAAGATPATAGLYRSPNNTNGPCWRNAANTANFCVKLNASNEYEFDAPINLIGTAGPSTVTEIAAPGAPATAGTDYLYVDSTTNRWTTHKNGGTAKDYVTTNDTQTLAGKSYDAEGTGNVLTIPRRLWFPAAGCNNATAGSIWDLPTANPAVAACVTGTNTQKGVLDFADAASLSAQITYKLPSTWTGTVDATIKWLTTAITGDVVWQLATICVADAETDDPAFNTASTVTDTAKGTTNQTNDAAITTVTVTGCAAGELMHVKILRDAAHASDTLAATARLIGVELVIREAI